MLESLPPSLEPSSTHGSLSGPGEPAARGADAAARRAMLGGRLVIALVFLCVWPMVGYGAKQAWDNNRNRIEEWLPAAFEETQQLLQFLHKFGSDELLMISWEGCDLESQLNPELINQITAPDNTGTVWFSQAFSGNSVLDQLQKPPQSLTRGQSMARLRGVLIGANGKDTCVVALVSKSGMRDRHSAVAWARRISQQVTGLSESEIHIGGQTIDSVVIDETSALSLLELNAISFVCTLIVLGIILRNVLVTLTLFLAAMFNEQAVLALVHYSGGKMDSLLLLTANIAFILTISSGLHGLSYYRSAVALGVSRPRIAAWKAAFLPTSLAALTTSIGFASLCVSEIQPIAQFGYYSAIIVPWSMLVALGLMLLWADASWKTIIYRKFAKPLDARSPTDALRAIRYARWLQRYGRYVILAWCVVVVIGAINLVSLRTAVGTTELLQPEAKMLKDYRWLEERIGPLVPVEFVVRFAAGDKRKLVERMQVLGILSKEIGLIPEMGVRWSALNLLPPLPRDGGLGAEVRQTVANSLLAKSLPALVESRVLYQNDEGQYWRISSRVSGAEPPSFAPLLENLQIWVEEIQADPRVAPISIEISGGVPVTYLAQRQLLEDLFQSFLTAFLLIAVVMGIMLRDVRAGLVATLPNAVPGVLVFGFMSAVDASVELGAMLTASAAMGVAADNTLHLIHCFQRSFRQHGDSVQAMAAALSACSRPIVQTTVVCVLGMAIFAFSPFVPTSRFAWLMLSLLSIALLAALTLTPAMLLGRLGRLFVPHGASARIDLTVQAATTS